MARWLALVLAVRLVAPPEVLTDEAAKEHLARANEAFEAEDYAAAIPELKSAYAIEANPMLLYAWAQAERLNGDCKRAVELYRRFLDTKPSDDQVRLAEANIVDCEAETGGEPPPPPPVANEEPPKDTEPTGPKARPWYKDPAGDTLVAVGAATTIAGGVVFALGMQEAADAPNADSEGAYFDRVDKARRRHTAGAVVMGVGGAILLAGVIRWIVVATKGKRGQSEKAASALGAPGLRIRF